MTSDRDATGDRGLRAALLAIEELRGDLLKLAAHVIALEEELGARAEGVQARIPELLAKIRAADVHGDGRVHLGDPIDKYQVPPLPDGGPPCLELLPICQARCCSLDVPLSTQDLDEGVIRWDRGAPYLIQHRDGRCVHQTSEHACACYEHRPAPCREYDCREDRRIWIDYDKRIPTPIDERPPDRTLTSETRHVLSFARQLSFMAEATSLRRRR